MGSERASEEEKVRRYECWTWKYSTHNSGEVLCKCVLPVEVRMEYMGSGVALETCELRPWRRGAGDCGALCSPSPWLQC